MKVISKNIVLPGHGQNLSGFGERKEREKIKAMKKLFSTPKRAVITTLCIVFLVLAAAAAAVWAVRSSQISRSEAIAAALADAGLKESAVSALRARLEFDDGRFQYEVEFYCDGVTYEYAVQAKDGDIISRDIEGGSALGRSGQGDPSGKENTGGQKAPIGQDGPAEGQAPAGQRDPADPGKPGDSQSESVCSLPTAQELSLEEAKAQALADAGLTESEVTFTKERLDYDDGVRVYDIEFYTSDAEYEYEINASDGSVHSKSTETFSAGQGSGNGGAGGLKEGDIGAERAKEIALEHAGLTESDVRFVKAELDRDDRIVKYEIEFYAGMTEYSYEIDAVSGEILEYDVDRD